MLFWIALGVIFFFVFAANRWVFFLLLAGWLTAWFLVFKKSKHKAFFIIALLALLLGSWILINYTPVQNFLVKRVTNVLSDKLHTKVEIKHVDFSLFNKMLVEGLLVEDRQKDTLLYAGTATVNITDWFFLKDKATLKYLGLKNTEVNLTRTDSVWNYQFLLDYFSSPKKSASTDQGGLEFDFKTLELENLRFNKTDKWIGQDMTVSLTKAGIEADSLDLGGKHFAIKSISLSQPYFSQSDYTGNKSSLNIQPDKTTTAMSIPGQYKWNNDGWLFNVNSIDITDGTFKNDKETERLPYTDRFDGQHLLFGAINGSIKNIRFAKDTIWADIKLVTKERSGFEVKKIQSHVKFTPEIMEFNQLDLVTPNSRLGNYYAMKYDDFNNDMNDFIHSVSLSGRFEDSRVASDDIAFFAPALKDWHRVIELKGNAKGTIDNLTSKSMLIKSGSTLIDGEITMRGLPDINNTFIDFKSNDLVTNYNDLVTIIPSLKKVTKPSLQKLGNINYKGNFTGFINDFVTYGNISTSLGNIIADLNMKLPENKPATYSGKLSSAGFNLGQFINSKDLGNIALDGNVTGSGFTLKDLKANFRGNVKQLYFSGYNYSNIVVDGNFDKKIFSGHGSIDDPNLKLEDFNGSIDFTGANPAYNFDALLKKSNFKTLQLSKDDFSLSGHLNLNFTGTNIDNFSGTARVYDALLRHDSTRLSFDSLTLRSFMTGNQKHLEFQTNELEGNITGEFNILQLPDAFSIFLSRYYPAYITRPKNAVNNEDFSFTIKTRNADEFVQLIDKRLKGFDNAEFSGSLNLAKNELNVKGNVPYFVYDGKIFNNVLLESRGNLDTLTTKITSGDIALNDSLHFPGSHLLIKSHNDVSTVQVKTSAGKTLNEAELNATVTTLNDGVRIHFSPSSFIINDKKWELENDGELTLRKSYIEASEVKFLQGEQEITFATEMDEETDKINVVARLKKVNINDFTPLFLKKPRLEGVLTGTITLKDPFGKQFIEYDAQADNFRLDDKLIGNVPMNGSVNTQTGLVKVKAGANSEFYKFSIDGFYNYKDSTGNQMNFDLGAERFDLSILDNYLGTIFSEIKGNATSTLNMQGGKDHQYLTGTVNVDSCSLKVNYTQCRYRFGNKTIIFNPDEIDLGSLQVKDDLGNSGTASGKLHHKLFDEFDFENMSFETGKMLLLNTTKKDNDQFYGRAIGSARMTLNGPVTDLKMKINGKTSGVDSSHIFLPTGDSKEAGKIDYIEFVKLGHEMEQTSTKQGTNIFIDMDLEATPTCKIDVILDEATGDILKGQGNGKLNIKVGTREPVSMRGQYNITQGEYKFNFQTVLQKYFNIKNGSTITWNGDPYQAAIKIDAEYLAQRVDLSSLSSSSGRQIKQKSDLSIIAHLTNTLKQPKITFEFLLPQDNDVSKDPIVIENLKKFTRDDNEMNRQVASLLLFNTFVTETGGSIGNSTSAFLAGTVGQVISNYLNNKLTQIFQQLVKNKDVTPYISLNSNYDLTNPAVIKALQASSNFGFKWNYFNGRLIISIGGNVDLNNPYILQARNTNVLLTPDFTIEYIVSKNGKLRIVGFQKTSVDATLGQRNKTGVRLSYQKEFDKKRYRTPADADKPKPKPEIKGSPNK